MSALRFTTTRAIGAAIALTVSAGAVAAQTPMPSRDTTMRDSTMRGTMGTMQDSTRRSTTNRTGTAGATRVRKDGYGSTNSGSSMQVRKDAPSNEVAPTPAPMAPAPMPTPAPAPAPMIDSSSMMRDTSMSTSTTTTSTTTTTVTQEQPPMGRPTRFGNGFYVGVQGGANFPQNDINTFYKTGYGAGVQMGWDPTTSPIGLRVNAMWNRLQGQDLSRQRINNATFTGRYADSDLYSAFADAKLRLPFGRFLGATSGLYAVGGGGVAYFRNFQTFQNVTGTTAGQSVTGRFNAEDATKFALNGGGGFSFGVGPASLFIEGRYVRVFTQNRNTDYVPVTIGLTFH